MTVSNSDKRKLEKLAPFADLYYQIYALSTGLTIKQMKALAACCDVPSIYNCGWTTFGVAPIVKEILEEKIRVKEYAAKEARNAKRRKTA